MSAWYVLSAMGFYPVCPGSNEYVIGFPLFDKVVLHQENGNTLTITKDSDKPYIQSVTLNGKPLTRSFITYDEIFAGGTLSFVMGDKPSASWGKGDRNMPVSRIEPKRTIIPVPVFSTDKVSFQDKTMVRISMPKVMINDNMRRKDPDEMAKTQTESKKKPHELFKAVSVDECVIYYTTDGSRPSAKNGIEYKEPILVDKDMTIKAIAVDGRGQSSKVAVANYVRYTRDKDLTYITKPDPQYFAGGDAGLIDNLRGIENYRIGGWQGFTTDCEVVIDLREVKPISRVGAGCLEEQRAWIFYPSAIEVYVSDDGKNYKRFGSQSFKVERTDGAHFKDLEVKGNAKARYVKIVVKNYGKLPEWHLSAGQQSWLFVDEVWVR